VLAGLTRPRIVPGAGCGYDATMSIGVLNHSPAFGDRAGFDLSKPAIIHADNGRDRLLPAPKAAAQFRRYVS
jgi:hypothetical protein